MNLPRTLESLLTMTTKTSSVESRLPLTKERILETAVALADEIGIDAVSMRRLGQELGVEAMSLYNHVANKEALLDGVAGVIIEKIHSRVAHVDAGEAGRDWKAAMRERIMLARSVMLEHKWAPALLETRTTMTPQLLLYFNGLLEIMRAGGLSYELAHHAMHALGSRALGFTQELFEPDAGSDDEEVNDEVLAEVAPQVPLLLEMMEEIVHEDPDGTIGWCDDEKEFTFGLDLLLDGLEARRVAQAS